MDGVVGRATGIDCHRDCSQVLAQTNKLMGTKDRTWQALPSAWATRTPPGLADAEGTLGLQMNLSREGR